MDEVLNRLETLNVGCTINGQFAGALCCADDLTLLAPSRSVAQRMLDECQIFANDFDVIFNAEKTQLLLYKPESAFRGGDLRMNGVSLT
jgi:hypothetical protein